LRFAQSASLPIFSAAIAPFFLLTVAFALVSAAAARDADKALRSNSEALFPSLPSLFCGGGAGSLDFVPQLLHSPQASHKPGAAQR
jgi:hypothetical protein